MGNLIGTKGHVGDDAANDWIAMVLAVYQLATGRPPRTSVGAIGRTNESMAGGPLLRFLAAAGHPLGIRFSPHGWRQRVRSLLKTASREN
jgi:hypothetical protein